MRNEGGYACISSPDGMIQECSTFTCFHCNTVVHVPPKADVNFVGMCTNCMKPICQRCSGLRCEPFEKKLEQMEASYHARRSYGI